MKTACQHFAIFAMLALTASGVIAQPVIYLEQSFKDASTAWIVKRKGLSAIGKYEFGPYRMVSGKTGWTKTKSKIGLFSGDSSSESQTRSSFVFTGNQNDTLTANLITTAVLQVDEKLGFVIRSLTNWSLQDVTESYEVFAADFSNNTDTVTWQQVIAYPVGAEITGAPSEEELDAFKGNLNNGATTILIKQEIRFINSKIPTLLYPVEGYFFILDGNTIAAVQTAPINKRTVWIRNDLQPDLKFVLAASSATFLIKSDQNAQ